MFTLRRVLTVWGALCLVGWLVLGGLAEHDAAQCRADYGLFCLPGGLSLALVAFAAAVVWLIGALVMASGWEIRARSMRRRARRAGRELWE